MDAYPSLVPRLSPSLVGRAWERGYAYPSYWNQEFNAVRHPIQTAGIETTWKLNTVINSCCISK